ncbi:hypothetical protein [Infirmifilum sp. SLHALR2]
MRVRVLLLALFVVSLLVIVSVRANNLDARVSGTVADIWGKGKTGTVSGSNSNGPVSLCITGSWALKYGWTLAVTQGGGSAYSYGTTSHSASLTGLGSGSDTLDVDG